ncbi:thioredoxin-like protein [Martensiomyces pterosporus]|nr:thioredoxin-like protein [Martensiomyces pterosporus]
MDNKIKETARRALRDDDDALSDDELLAELENDPELERFREARLDQLKREIGRTRELRSQGHGEYTEIQREEEMVKMLSDSKRLIVHFTHPQFTRCKILDTHLRALAPHHFDARFASINVDKCPFLVQKFQVRVLPCLLVVSQGSVVERLVGFEGFGNTDTFSTEVLERRLARTGVIRLPKGELAKVPVSQRPVSYSNSLGEDAHMAGDQSGKEDELDY